MFCTECGEKNKSKAQFCKNCGEKISKEYGGFKIRLGAYFVDFIGVIISAIAIGFILGYLGLYDQELVDTAGVFFDYLIYVLYSTLFLTMWSTTPGKKLYGMIVYNESEKPLSFSDALKRSLLQPLSFILFGAGFWNMEKNRRKQAWHDKTAHTVVVVKEKVNYLIPIVLTILGIILYLYLYSLPETSY